MTEIYHRKKNQLGEIEKHKELIEKQLFPADYKKLGQAMDYVHLYAKVLKVISPKKTRTGFQEIRNIIALTHEQELIMIDVQDRSFIDSASFPKENSFVYFQNLTYTNTMEINKKDLSFVMHEEPVKPNEVNQKHFIYDTYKLSVRSQYKLVTANLNEHTSSLKLLS